MIQSEVIPRVCKRMPSQDDEGCPEMLHLEINIKCTRSDYWNFFWGGPLTPSSCRRLDGEHRIIIGRGTHYASNLHDTSNEKKLMKLPHSEYQCTLIETFIDEK